MKKQLASFIAVVLIISSFMFATTTHAQTKFKDVSETLTMKLIILRIRK